MRILVTVLILTGLAISQAKTPSPKKYTCEAKADQKCPSAPDYAKLKAYQEKYTAPPPPVAPQSEQDEINGLWARVVQNPPDGYYWPGSKDLVYVKVPAGMKWDKQQMKLVPDKPAADAPAK